MKPAFRTVMALHKFLLRYVLAILGCAIPETAMSSPRWPWRGSSGFAAFSCTVAYQTYAAMLGVRLSAGPLQTGDIDIAQFKNVSVAIGDSTPPALDVLKEVDKTFRAIPHVVDGRRVTSYTAKGD